LSERQILVEAFGREPFNGRREQGHERAARRIGPHRAAIEIHGHAAASRRVLEKTQVLLRRAEKHRHLVERHAGGRLVQDPPHDFERFAPFARRGQQLHVAGLLSLRRRGAREHVAPKMRQV